MLRLTTKQDVDECLIGADNCDVLLQICVNQPGGFACVDRKENPNIGSRPGRQLLTFSTNLRMISGIE